MIKTIFSGQAESKDELLIALQNALCKEFSTTITSYGAITPFPGSNIGYHFYINGDSIFLTEINAHGTKCAGSKSITFSAGGTYALKVFYSKKGAAVSVKLSGINDATLSPMIIAKNNAGGVVGLLVSNTVEILAENALVRADWKTNVNSIYAFSFARYPDFINGAIFDDVYGICSSPINAFGYNDKIIIHTKDKDFIPIGDNSMSDYGCFFAIPV